MDGVALEERFRGESKGRVAGVAESNSGLSSGRRGGREGLRLCRQGNSAVGSAYPREGPLRTASSLQSLALGRNLRSEKCSAQGGW